MVMDTRNWFRVMASTAIVALAGTPCFAQGSDRAVGKPAELAVASLPNPMPAPSTTGDLRFAQSGSQRLYSSMSGDEIESLLKSMNFIYTRSTDRAGDPIFRVAVDRYRITLITDQCNSSRCKIIQLFVGFDLRSGISLSKINEWNRTKRFSRAYVDDEGDPLLKAEIALDGGVSLENIKTFILIYSGSVETFAEFIGFK